MRCYLLNLCRYKYILFGMAEYRFEYDKNYIPDGRTQQSLQHYRIQIRKLEASKQQLITNYQKRITQLQSELKHHRQPIFQKKPSGPQPNQALNYEIYQKDLQIKELKQQNSHLRESLNNPNQILIKKNNTLDIVEEKQNEINRLKKVLIDLESKFDGQYFTEHQIKKQYDMVVKQNQQLKLSIRAMEIRRPAGREEVVSTEILDHVKLKKDLETVTRQNEVLKRALLQKQEQLRNKNNRLTTSKKGSVLGVNTQIEELKLQLEQYKAKNRELKDNLDKAQQDNERIQSDQKIRFTNVQKMEKQETFKEIPESLQYSQTARKIGRYSQYNLQEFDTRASQFH